LASKRIIYTT